ncbi:sugar ABC transporter permease [Vallitalea longa]|uniref:Sugar ABC transporter permease n=1 Tax=Vallitalea longa TaxID=2936439 RepID=A0A9W5YCP9_9FIRM|nr:carbohydrate ABC transporter permease [Vallitalea longa]GKX29948.1 sugar ABC transporter permease [Vallitalea longa]
MSKGKNKIRNTIFYIILSIFAFVQLFPFYLRIVYSLQPKDFLPEIGKIYLLPEGFHFENYIEAWKMSNLGVGYKNSLIYVTIFTIVSAFIAILVGYVIAKKKFRGRKIIFIMLLSTLMVPAEVLLIPNYILIRDLNLLNKLAALIIPGLVNIVGIFLAKQFLETLPDSIIESAYIDGASEMKIFFKVVLPLSGPVIATYFIITYTQMWNDYLWPMIVTNKSEVFTVQLCMMGFQTNFQTGYDMILESAALITTLAPIVIVFLIFQKKFVEGISMTGIK